jgi:hypothetical protein
MALWAFICLEGLNNILTPLWKYNAKKPLKALALMADEWIPVETISFFP